MGTVLKYRNQALNKFVAIKMLKTNSFSEDAYKRFIREGRAAGRLRHKNLLTVHDLGITEDNQPYMVMDYFEGKTFADLAKEGMTLSETQLVEIFAQCCDAMSYAHSNGILHRDLKPSNIMVSNTEAGLPEAMIFDFGISKLLDDNTFAVTKAGEVFGSPLYMSPEQCDGKPLDAKSDIYSLGCTFYEILTGAPPFSADSLYDLMHKHKNETPMSLREASLGKTFSPVLEQTIAKMLKKDPAERPESMDDVKGMLLRESSDDTRDPNLVSAATVGHSSGPRGTQGASSKAIAITSTTDSVGGFRVRHVVIALVSISFLTLIATYTGRSGSNNASRISAPLPAASSSPPGSSSIPAASSPFAPGGSSPAAGKAALTLINPADSLPPAQLPSSQSTAPTGDPLPDSANQQSTERGAPRNAKEQALFDSKRSEDIGFLAAQVAKHEEEVDLSGFALLDKDLEELTPNHRMRVLNINHTNIGDAGFRVVGKMKTLQAIRADNTQITNNGISALTSLPRLQCLHLSENHLDDGCTAFLSKIQGLEELTLRDTLISDKGLKNIAKLKKLRHLQLNRTTITDEGVKILIENLPNLEALHLRANPHITDKSFEYLGKAKRLRAMTVAGCNVSSVTWKEFMDRHPFVHEAANNAETMMLQLIKPDEVR